MRPGIVFVVGMGPVGAVGTVGVEADRSEADRLVFGIVEGLGYVL